MLDSRLILITALFSAVTLSACTAAKVAGKVVTAPVKVAWTGSKLAGKGIWYTGKGTYYVTKYGGKGIWYVGTAPVKITAAALETTSDLLSITTQALDLAGNPITLTRMVAAAGLEQELATLEATLHALHAIRRIVAVTVDVVG